MNEEEPFVLWDFFHSLFFVITVVSTIGYGNLAPTTMFTRIFMIFYALIGIPMNGIVMVTLGEYFAKSFKKLYHRWKSTRIEGSTAKLGLIGQIILYSIPGLTFFIFLPATIISVFEDWPYYQAVYYAFVTLTTIGFGDIVADVKPHYDFSMVFQYFYKIFLLVWILVGLGYLVMVIGFITQGMRHKRVIAIEKMLAENIIRTPQKIRHELRQILQEFLFLRVKPVYKGEFEYTPQYVDRSQSCPDLNLWRNMNSPSMVRKRAMSECHKHAVLQKVQSDTDLDKIDRERTFRTSDAFMQQKDLLLKVVGALTATAEGDRGILASDHYEDISPSFKPKRRRAVSDIRPPTKFTPIIDGHTWYGDDASKAVTEFKIRKRTFSAADVDRPVHHQNIFQRFKNRFIVKDDKNIDVEKQVGLDTPPGLSDHSANAEMFGRRYSTLSASQEQVLEQTSIADFIRALSAITVPETKFELEPRRKLGTASLTPPNITPARRRRMSIRPNYNNRRASLIPPSTTAHTGGRRFSLRPLDEHVLSPPPYSVYPAEARNSFRAPPQGRRFSVRPTPSNVTSPVKRQLNKRDRADDS